MVEGGEAFGALHEENSGKVEKRCFAGNCFLHLLVCSVADAHSGRCVKAEYSRCGPRWPRDRSQQWDRQVVQTIFVRMHSIVSGPVWLFAMCCARSAERRALRELAQQPHLLNDLGLTREQVLREASKLFWRR